MSYSLTLRVSGARACFSPAEFKTERASYEVITPSAARGIFDAVYWRPGLRWVIDRIHVLNPIRFQSLSRNEVGDCVPVATVRHAMRSGDLHALPCARPRTTSAAPPPSWSRSTIWSPPISS